MNRSFSTRTMAKPEAIMAASVMFISVAVHLSLPLKILIRSPAIKRIDWAISSFFSIFLAAINYNESHICAKSVKSGTKSYLEAWFMPTFC